MSYQIKAYMDEGSANIEPLSVKRDFFDNSTNKTAYKCLPITSASMIGWAISFPKDISFIWDGEFENFPEHVKILSGEEYAVASTNKTIVLNPRFSLKTDENITTLINPVPNQFSDEWATISFAVSTSFFENIINLGIYTLKSNKIITIKAGTPVAIILPISLSSLNNSSIELLSWEKRNNSIYNDDYENKINENLKNNKLSNFYKNATNHKNEKIGNHEVKFLNLKIINGDLNV